MLCNPKDGEQDLKQKKNIASQLFLAFRIFVSLGILVYLVTMFDWQRVGVVLTKLRLQYAWPCPLLLLAAVFVMAIRWRSLLCHFDIALRLGRAFLFYLISCFYSIFLPGVIGGDVIRVGLCAEQGGASLVAVATTALIERVFGFLMVLLIGCGALLLLPTKLESELGAPVTGALVIATVVFLAAAVMGLVFLRYLPLIRLQSTQRLLQWLLPLIRILAIVRQIPGRVLFQVALLSGVAQTLDIIASYLVARSLHIELPFSFFLAVMPLVYLGTVLPISLGGLGVREGLLVALFTRIGELPSDAVTYAFLLYLNRVIIAALGGSAQLVTGIRTNTSKDAFSVPKSEGRRA